MSNDSKRVFLNNVSGNVYPLDCEVIYIYPTNKILSTYKNGGSPLSKDNIGFLIYNNKTCCFYYDGPSKKNVSLCKNVSNATSNSRNDIQFFVYSALSTIIIYNIFPNPVACICTGISSCVAECLFYGKDSLPCVLYNTCSNNNEGKKELSAYYTSIKDRSKFTAISALSTAIIQSSCSCLPKTYICALITVCIADSLIYRENSVPCIIYDSCCNSKTQDLETPEVQQMTRT